GVAGGTCSLGIQVQGVEVADGFGKLADVVGGHTKSADGDLFADEVGVQFNHSGLLALRGCQSHTAPMIKSPVSKRLSCQGAPTACSRRLISSVSIFGGG